MTERQIENRVKKLKAIEKQRKDLEATEGRNQAGHGKQGSGRTENQELHHPLERDHQQHT